MSTRPPHYAEASFIFSRVGKRGGENMDIGMLKAVRERQDAVRKEIARHRLGAALQSHRASSSIVLRCRRVLGRAFVDFGRMLEGDDDPLHDGVSLPCN